MPFNPDHSNKFEGIGRTKALDDPAAFVNTDIHWQAAFQEMGRQTCFYTLTGVAPHTYGGGLVQPGDTIPTIKVLRP